MTRNYRNAAYFVTTVLLMLLLVPAFANEKMGYSNYQKQYSKQYNKQSLQSTIAPVGSGNTTTYQSSYEEAAQTAYSSGGVIGKCLAAGGAGLQTRSWGLSFGFNKALKDCKAKALAAMLMQTGVEEDFTMGRTILHTQYRDWEQQFAPKGPNWVCKKNGCYKVEPVDVSQPDN